VRHQPWQQAGHDPGGEDQEGKTAKRRLEPLRSFSSQPRVAWVRLDATSRQKRPLNAPSIRRRGRR